MTIYERLLQYYITSTDFFIDKVEWFWELNNQIGICGAENFRFKSKLYRKYENKLQVEGGYHLLLGDRLIQDYFSNIDSEEILFAVILSHWMELKQNHIFPIRNSRTAKTAWNRLAKSIIMPQGIFYIHTEVGEMTAVKSGCTLLAENGKKYEIN